MHSEDCITVTVGGDLCPAGMPSEGLKAGRLSAAGVVGRIKPLFEGSDLHIVNLECPLTRRGVPIRKTGPYRRADPNCISLLTELAINVATLANNHIRDFGDEGVADTLETCASKGIQTVGAGRCLTDARRPLVINVKGRTLAILNAAEQEFADATDKRSGANPFNLIDILHDIKAARAQADHVLLILHGGLEHVPCPSPESVRVLRFLAEQGVAAIVRHHAHCVQAFEIWQGVPILYGLGNLLFDRPATASAAWSTGVLATLAIHPDDSCGVTLHPVVQDDESFGVAPASAEHKDSVLRDIADGAGLIADPERFSTEWSRVLSERRAEYFCLTLIPLRALRRFVLRLGLASLVHPSQRQRLMLGNLLRNPALREVLAGVYEEDSTLSPSR